MKKVSSPRSPLGGNGVRGNGVRYRFQGARGEGKRRKRYQTPFLSPTVSLPWRANKPAPEEFGLTRSTFISTLNRNG
jgi:hypothetical protein